MKRGFELPLLAIGGFAPLITNVVFAAREGGLHGAVREFSRDTVGYDPSTAQFNYASLSNGTLPIIVGTILHKAIGEWLGVNKALRRARVPVIRL